MTDTWSVVEHGLDLDALGAVESRFALANGHLGLRANLDEGEPFGDQGTYLAGFHELRPLPYAEAGYGYPESGQTVINVTNGKLIRLLVDDEPFDVRYGELRHHSRRLDMRAGALRRSLNWVSPAGQRVGVESTRLVSMSQRAVAAIAFEVWPLDTPARVVVQSELIANEPQHLRRSGDPRVAAALDGPLVAEDAWSDDHQVALVHRARASGLRVAAAMAHEVECPNVPASETHCGNDLGRVSFTVELEAGERFRLVKYLGYGWSAVRSVAALRDQAIAAITAARATGWDGLLAEQRAWLDDFWAAADVEIDGDDELQRAVRYSLFAVAQATARGEGQGVPAKGLTGAGYDGHYFWDGDAFVLPMLSRTLPAATAHALRWRCDTLEIAERRAAALRLSGAAFPWRTISGEECSGYWPAGTAAFHVNAAIADAVVGHVHATGDDRFESTIGLRLLVATARLWSALGHWGADDRFHIDGITGPDEYSAISDDNVYTNVTAARNLRAAAAAVERHPRAAAELDVGDDEAAGWARRAAAMAVPFDDRLGVHPQAVNFTAHQPWNFDAMTADDYPLMNNYPYFELYRRQVVKQADVVMAIDRCPDAFDADVAARDFAFYEAITVRDSSLSAASQGVVAARLGHLELALAYLRETALIDLSDSHDNTADGIHIAAAAGAWHVLVRGFAGLRTDLPDLVLTPRCPPGLRSITVSLLHRGSRLRVGIDPDRATYVVTAGPAVVLSHHGATVEVGSAPVELAIPPLDGPAPVHQPAGRTPPIL